MRRAPLSLVPEDDDPQSIQVFANGAIGDEPTRFLIDTGATTCVVPATAATNGLAAAIASAGRGASGTVADGDVVVLPEIRVGDLVAVDVEADRLASAPPHPLLGMNVLGAYACRFRFAAGRIEFDAAQPHSVEPRRPKDDDDVLPFVDLAVGGYELSACWDTGASRTVVARSWAEGHPDLVEIDGSSTGHDSAGVVIEAATGTFATCAISGVEFGPSPCVVIDLDALNRHLASPLEIIIGVPLMRAADWWFDFPNRRWLVQPVDSGGD